MKIIKWIAMLTFWALLCTSIGFSQTMATLSLPNTSAVYGETIVIPIIVSTNSTIGLAQIVVEFDSTILQFQKAVLGKDIQNFQLLTQPTLPFSTSASETNKNVLVQLSGGGMNSFTGQDKEVAELEFLVISYGNSRLVFDQAPNHTFLTTTDLKDIAGNTLNFVNGDLITDVQTVGEILAPSEFILHRNYPNPFNPMTRISYELPQPAKAVIKVLNLMGQEVRTLVAQDMPAGYFEVFWNGRDNAGHRVSSGVYLYQMQAGNFAQTKRMLLLQ